MYLTVKMMSTILALLSTYAVQTTMNCIVILSAACVVAMLYTIA